MPDPPSDPNVIRVSPATERQRRTEAQWVSGSQSFEAFVELTERRRRDSGEWPRPLTFKIRMHDLDALIDALEAMRRRAHDELGAASTRPRVAMAKLAADCMPKESNATTTTERTRQ
ncbi:MAG: hypothetical protein ACHREM_20135 [Polyangiales bacterium]